MIGVGTRPRWPRENRPLPFKHHAARRHRIPRAQYRVRNWPAYDAGLRRRGDLTLLCGRPKHDNGFRCGSMPIGLTHHGAATAGLCQAPYRRCNSGLEAPIGVGQRSGRLRPYVRPVARCSPLAIMGVRMRVRRQSGSRARGTKASTASPELSRPQPSPSRRSALAAGSGGLAPAAYRMSGYHAVAAEAAAACPVAR